MSELSYKFQTSHNDSVKTGTIQKGEQLYSQSECSFKSECLLRLLNCSTVCPSDFLSIIALMGVVILVLNYFFQESPLHVIIVTDEKSHLTVRSCILAGLGKHLFIFKLRRLATRGSIFEGIRKGRKQSKTITRLIKTI